MKADALSWILEDRLVVVLRSDHVARPRQLAEALLEAGVRCIELTFTDPAVLEGIRAMAAVSGVAIGAGTVPDAAAAEAALDAGASFLVTPGLSAEVAAVARERNTPFLEGAFSPTEVATALSHGASAVKIFPASTGGAGHVRALLGPFTGAALVPSGGVGVDNAAAYLDAGAAALSASVSSAESLRDGDVAAVAQGAAALRAAIVGWNSRSGATPPG